MSMIYDAVIIGSGFGGAINALRLAEAGRSVLMLERGRRYAPGEFPRDIKNTEDVAMEPFRSPADTWIIRCAIHVRCCIRYGRGSWWWVIDLCKYPLPAARKDL